MVLESLYNVYTSILQKIVYIKAKSDVRFLI